MPTVEALMWARAFGLIPEKTCRFTSFASREPLTVAHNIEFVASVLTPCQMAFFPDSSNAHWYVPARYRQRTVNAS